MNRKMLYLILAALMLFSATPALAEMECTQSMEITDVRYGVNAEVGVDVSFSDIGCAVIWRNLQCAMDQMEFDASSLAHDYNTQEEIEMKNAHYALEAGIETPMGYGIAAFKNREDAEKFVAEKGGKVLSYNELLELELK